MTAPRFPGLPASCVETWLSLPDQSQKLSRDSDLCFESGPITAAQVIHLDERARYQQLEGIGAAMTESSAWLLMNVLDEARRNATLRDLFSRDGIGLNYLRLPMGASDFALSDYTYADQPDPDLTHFSIARDQARVIPALKLARAVNPQLRLMGSPWSAPAWMKQGGNLHGGSLSPEHYQAFANYHLKFIQAYAAEGLPIASVTPQNEPMLSVENYPTMLMEAEAQQIFVRDHLGPAFQRAGLGARILILDHNWDLWEYPLKVLADPAAAAFVDGIAFHCYAGDVALQSRVHDAFPDKGIWFTECSGGGWSPEFAKNVSWMMRHLIIGNFRNWGNSLLMWNLALDERDGPKNGGCPNCRGVITINQSTGAVTYNEEYYTLGHVSKFVNPGAHRIESTPFTEGGPENVAFLNPDGSLVLILHSTAETSFAVEWGGRHFTCHLPAYGTATFKWTPESE